MKRLAFITMMILCCSSPCLAIKSTLFSDTDTYINRAKDIVIAKCASAPEYVENGTLNLVDIRIVLKGDKALGKLMIFAIDPLEKSTYYLLMNIGGYTHETDFLATSELSIVPIPSFVNFDMLKGKDLEGKLHFIFASRLYAVQKKLKPLLEEKTVLEKALLDRTDNLYVSPKPVHIGKIHTTFATDYHKGSVTYLNLNSRQMEWSRAGEKTGYLYPHDPGKRRVVWEFASIDYSTFKELEGTELKVRFSGTHIPPGGSTIVVKEGQMVLARHIDEPSVIYILKFDRQEENRVFVKYTIIENK